jgi:molybdenum cofactor guanylyltransferase
MNSLSQKSSEQPESEHPEIVKKSVGGIILCGGRSRRMGNDKPTMPFGPETLIERTIGILESVLSPIIVVAHENQALPQFPDHVYLVHDELPDLGPMGGLLTGLSEMKRRSPETKIAYVSSCDAPFLKPEFISKMIELSNSYEIAVPYDGKYHHSLSAVYQIGLVEKIRNLIKENQLRPLHLFEQSNTHQVSCEELKEVDAELESLINTNTPEEYHAALKKAGFPISH